MDCILCKEDGGDVLWRDATSRVVHAAVEGYPQFLRVIWNAHVAEMTDLDASARERLMQVVFAAEQVLREIAAPDKINLASLGNQVPHLHWHVIPRYRDDPHFPGAVWSSPQRAGAVRAALDTDRCAAALATALS